MIERLRKRLSHPAIALSVALAGIYLAGLPTVYGVFASDLAGRHHHAIRWPLILLWIAAALWVALIASVHDWTADRILDRMQAYMRLPRRADLREDAFLRAFKALLTPGATGIPSSFLFTAFREDDVGELVPFYAEEAQTWQRWPSGHGAVGVIWEDRKNDGYILLPTREDIRTANLPMTDEQRTHYEHLTMIGARVIKDEQGTPRGVLGVSCADGSDFVAAGGIGAHRLLASDLGLLLGEISPPARHRAD